MQRKARSLQPTGLDQLRSRDPDAVAAEFRVHRKAIEEAARSLGFTPPDAEEITQSVWVTFLEILPRFEGRSQVRTFLYGILRRKASQARRQAVQADTLEVEKVDSAVAVERTAEEALSAAELSRAVNNCVKTLPPTERRAVELKILRENGSGDVSHQLGVSANYLGVILHRARAHLRDCLGAHFAFRR